MDYNTNNTPAENEVPTRPPVPKGEGMATAAMVMGILSLVTLFCVYPAFILGGIAIILAILSRGKDSKLMAQAKTGIITSCISIVLSCAVLIGSVAFIMSSPEFMDAFWSSYRSTLEDVYGEDYYEEMPEGFPFDEFDMAPEAPDVPSDATDI